MSINTEQKHQCMISQHYHVHSDLQDPQSTKALILYRRTDGVDLGSRCRQFHWIVHQIPECCNENFDPSVGEWCWMRLSKRPQPHLLQAFTRRWSQVTCPDKWTSLTAWIDAPTSTWNRPNWLSLAPKHTGAEFNFRQRVSIRTWKTLKKNNSKETGLSKSIRGYDCLLVRRLNCVNFLQFVLAPLIREPPRVHQVNPENKSENNG